MSIINEALKKAEEHLQKNSAKDNFQAPKPSGPKPFLLYILILLAGLLLSNFVFNLLSHKAGANGLASANQSHKIKNTQTLTPPVIQTTNPPEPPALISQPAKENTPAESNFVLNGIFFSDNDGYALVNNQIIRENDYVDGAKVSSITANTVKLDNAGQTIILSTTR